MADGGCVLLLCILPNLNGTGRFFHLNDCFRGDKCHMVHAPKDEVSGSPNPCIMAHGILMYHG